MFFLCFTSSRYNCIIQKKKNSYHILWQIGQIPQVTEQLSILTIPRNFNSVSVYFLVRGCGIIQLLVANHKGNNNAVIFISKRMLQYLKLTCILHSSSLGDSDLAADFSDLTETSLALVSLFFWMNSIKSSFVLSPSYGTTIPPADLKYRVGKPWTSKTSLGTSFVVASYKGKKELHIRKWWLDGD